MNRQHDKITAIYTRIGVGGADPDTTIRFQWETLTQYAKGKHFENIEIFSDVGFNGLSENRPKFHELMAAIESGKVDRLVVLSIDRLFRDYEKCCHFIEGKLSRYHVDLYAVNDDIAPETPFVSLLPALQFAKGGGQ